jgi:hypothetical protein
MHPTCPTEREEQIRKVMEGVVLPETATPCECVCLSLDDVQE